MNLRVIDFLPWFASLNAIMRKLCVLSKPATPHPLDETPYPAQYCMRGGRRAINERRQ
jgi:hypothetical protein